MHNYYSSHQIMISWLHNLSSSPWSHVLQWNGVDVLTMIMKHGLSTNASASLLSMQSLYWLLLRQVELHQISKPNSLRQVCTSLFFWTPWKRSLPWKKTRDFFLLAMETSHSLWTLKCVYCYNQKHLSYRVYSILYLCKNMLDWISIDQS